MAETGCVGHFIDDGKKQDQAVAICSNSPKAHVAQKTAQTILNMKLLTAQINMNNQSRMLQAQKKKLA